MLKFAIECTGASQQKCSCGMELHCCGMGRMLDRCSVELNCWTRKCHLNAKLRYAAKLLDWIVVDLWLCYRKSCSANKDEALTRWEIQSEVEDRMTL